MNYTCINPNKHQTYYKTVSWSAWYDSMTNDTISFCIVIYPYLSRGQNSKTGDLQCTGLSHTGDYGIDKG